MKAVSMKHKNGGDDLITNRLLNILKKSVPFKVNEIKQIRKHVYFVKTDHKPYILKGYSSLQRLYLQEAFTESLKAEGFHHSYSYYRILETPIYFNQKYFGWIEYIEPHRDRFSYQSSSDRKEGIRLLNRFHRTTKRLAKSYEMMLPRINLYEKWYERSSRFQKHIPLLRHYLKDQMINELMEWSKISLEGLKNENLNFGNDDLQPVILHGDVAHHNYLKSKSGNLYLIDFDLISIGNEGSDLLQYANRIFPFINWSMHELSKYEHINKYLNNRAFLLALMYPTDIFREWTRIIKDKTYQSPEKILPVMELTVDQFHLRRQLIKDLKNVVK